MHSDPPLYRIISSSRNSIAGIDDDDCHQTANVAACSDDVNFEANETRRRLCQSEVCLFSNLDNDNVRITLELAMGFGTAGLTSRRFCCRIQDGLGNARC